MALFTDGPPCSIEDLSAQDSQLLNVANVEGIDVTQKLELAHEELGLDLYTLLTRMSYVDQLLWISPKPQLDTVAVTPALKLWHAFRTLEMVYGDAYNSQLNDRYAGKRDQYHERAAWAKDKLSQNGLGIVQTPVAKARTPEVESAVGAIPDGTYYVTMAWVNHTGEEGASAEPAVITATGSTMAVQTSGAVPRNATGWNVYVGAAPDAMARQNAVPVPTGQQWVQPSSVNSAGPQPGRGQKPSYLQPIPRMIQRG
jgi:hypothetical protein